MRATEIIPQPLNEINMSPRSLKREALRIGATVGIEFEMIVPGVAGGDDDSDLIQDYSDNPRARSIQSICDFYHDGDYNGRRAIQELREALMEDYNEWFHEHAGEEWQKVAEKLITEYFAEGNTSGFDYNEALEDYMRTTLGLDDQQIQVALRAGNKAEEITSSKQLKLFADDNDPYAAYRAAQEAVDAQLQELVDDEIRSNGDVYNTVYDAWMEEYRDDNWDDLEEDWLQSKGIERMADVEGEYSNIITWPHWITENNGNGASIEDVASGFDYALGVPVKWSDNYHGARRDGNSWIIEPDGSLDPDSDDDRGLEFVSPPMPLEKMLKQMNEVYKWAQDTGCYTNRSTGLHMNVSIPGFQRDKLDYVKLAILLGDQHVLASFGRESNTYCKSAFEKVQQKARANPDTVKKVFELLKNKLNGIASTMIHAAYTDKYTSINVKDTYIEFRGPGGDYLDESTWSAVESTLCRFVVALDAACDENKHRKEYLKKLYTTLNAALPDDVRDTLELFTLHSAGMMSRANWEAELRRRGREREHARSGGDQRWWWTVFRRDNPNFQIEVVGTDRDDAIRAARAVVGTGWHRLSPSDFVASIVRPFQSDQSTEPVLPAHGSPDRRTDASGRPSREWIVRPRTAVRGVNVWGVDREQAIRVARMMFPSHIPDAVSDRDIEVTPA